MSMEDQADEMIGDIIARLIEGDMLSGEEWRPAATLDFLVQGLVASIVDEDSSPELKSLAQAILGDVLTSMTYLRIREPDEEQDAFDRKWEEIMSRIDRPEEKEEDD